MEMGTEFMVQAEFQGPMFKTSGIPPDVFRALSSWHKINGEVLRLGYRALHNKRNVPRVVQDDYETSLQTEKWSPVVQVYVRSTNGSIEYIQRGYDLVMDGLLREVPMLPLPIADKMMPIYGHLGPADGMQLSTEKGRKPAWLGQGEIGSAGKMITSGESMAPALGYAGYGQPNLRGVVYAVDRVKQTFAVNSTRTGRKVQNLPLDALNTPVIMDALNEYGAGGLVQLEAVAQGSDPLEGLRVHRLRRLNVPARLDEFHRLKDGWLKDWYVAPKRDGLDWLADRFEALYPDDVDPPHVYPTPEGGISAEWIIGEHRVIFEIDLDAHSGDWLQWDRRNEEEEESRRLDLNQESDWRYIVNQVRAMAGAQ